MVGWPHRLSGHEFEPTLEDGEVQGSLACCIGSFMGWQRGRIEQHPCQIKCRRVSETSSSTVCQ